MSNKEKYEGRIVDIFAPFGGRKLDTLRVTEVKNEDCLYGESQISGIETAYYLSDMITLKVKN